LKYSTALTESERKDEGAAMISKYPGSQAPIEDAIKQGKHIKTTI